MAANRHVGRAVVLAVERVPGGDRGGHRGHLPGRARRILTLGCPVEHRLAVSWVEELLELSDRDAAGPYRRVIRGIAGHREYPAGGRHDHGGAAVAGRAAGELALPHGRRQSVVSVLLQCGIDAGDQVVSRYRPHPAHGACDLPGRVHSEARLTGDAAQVAVVLLLEPGLADQVNRGKSGDRQLLLLELGGRDRLQVTDHLRQAGGDRLVVVRHWLDSGADPWIEPLILKHLERDPGRSVLQDRDRLIGRPRPAWPANPGRTKPYLAEHR